MAKLNDCTNPNRDSRDDGSDLESDDISVTEPINLREMDFESTHNPREWESLNLIKSKTFTIKDILGLDENEKSIAPKSDRKEFNCPSKSTRSINNPSNYPPDRLSVIPTDW